MLHGYSLLVLNIDYGAIPHYAPNVHRFLLEITPPGSGYNGIVLACKHTKVSDTFSRV
jgi:hypothetical protein